MLAMGQHNLGMCGDHAAPPQAGGQTNKDTYHKYIVVWLLILTKIKNKMDNIWLHGRNNQKWIWILKYNVGVCIPKWNILALFILYLYSTTPKTFNLSISSYPGLEPSTS